MNEKTTDILLIGGGLGGVAAALAALRLGQRVILSEESDWIGGQLTSQAVPPDEHPWIESTGCTASYRRLREGVRVYYRRAYPLTQAAREQVHFNPGQGFVSALCHEPCVALAVLYEMLAPHLATGRLEILLRYRPVARRMSLFSMTSGTTGAFSIANISNQARCPVTLSSSIGRRSTTGWAQLWV
ncbi:MAG: FAD-dependent oxidoreductase [Caldilineaceae bacterium]